MKDTWARDFSQKKFFSPLLIIKYYSICFLISENAKKNASKYENYALKMELNRHYAYVLIKIGNFLIIEKHCRHIK